MGWGVHSTTRSIHLQGASADGPQKAMQAALAQGIGRGGEVGGGCWGGGGTLYGDVKSSYGGAGG